MVVYHYILRIIILGKHLLNISVHLAYSSD